jgi:crossover junction endodeoxyribonuclease RuvC
MIDERPALGNNTPDKPLRVMGLDPGSLKMGFGILEERPGRAPLTLEAGVLAPKAGQPLPERLVYLFHCLNEIFTQYRPAEMALENVFAGRNVKAAFILGQARGVAMLAAAEHGLRIFEYAPRSVKKALTGSGSSDKEQVRRMVCRLLGVDLGAAPFDASDALSLAVCHLNSRALHMKGLI